MSAQERGDSARKHPELPGDDLGCFELNGQTCMYDRDNPQAYIIGDPVEVGTAE